MSGRAALACFVVPALTGLLLAARRHARLEAAPVVLDGVSPCSGRTTRTGRSVPRLQRRARRWRRQPPRSGLEADLTAPTSPHGSNAAVGLRGAPSRWPRGARLCASLVQLLDERVTIRRLPVLEQHLFERYSISYRVIAAIVIHRDMHACGLPVASTQRRRQSPRARPRCRDSRTSPRPSAPCPALA